MAPTLITLGSVAGEPMVLVTPPSPAVATTVTPAATAASLAWRMRSAVSVGEVVRRRTTR